MSSDSLQDILQDVLQDILFDVMGDVLRCLVRYNMGVLLRCLELPALVVKIGS